MKKTFLENIQDFEDALDEFSGLYWERMPLKRALLQFSKEKVLNKTTLTPFTTLLENLGAELTIAEMELLSLHNRMQSGMTPKLFMKPEAEQIMRAIQDTSKVYYALFTLSRTLKNLSLSK